MPLPHCISPYYVTDANHLNLSTSLPHLTFPSLRGGSQSALLHQINTEMAVSGLWAPCHGWARIQSTLKQLEDRCSPGSFGLLRNNGLIEDLEQTPDTVAWPGRALLFKRQEKRKAIFCLLSLCIASCAPGSNVTLFMTQNRSCPLYRTVIMCIAFRPQWPTGTEKSLTSLIKSVH